MKVNSKILIFLGITVFSLLTLSYYFWNKFFNGTNPKPVGSLISLETSKGLLEILVEYDGVRLQPFEDASYSFKFIFISKKEYPKLFEQGIANASFISAKVIDDKNDLVTIELANNQPDHGVYSSPYRLKVNPMTGVIEEIGARKYSEKM